ncbi:MAG TPA: hypothetical protein VFQ53_21675 [Kofleriaceae bacterium]|nr:hypothetical protein [Kofleriaceae bacterium]
MRAEDKELEGPELEREQRLEEENNLREQDELPVLAGEEVADLELGHRGRLFDALQLILAREQINISLLQLPQRETHALEFLQTAVSGRDVHLGDFVYAEDRRALLEQALAVLQQNLTHGSPSELAELQSKYDALTEDIAELRDTLLDLEDAQDDMIEEHARQKLEEASEGDEPEEGDEPAGDVEPGFVEAARSSLVGPERPEPAKPPSTLSGEPAVERAEHVSTLGDDEGAR